MTSPAAPRRPATDWIRVTSIASSGASGGRIDGSRRAIIVLPVPGGPGGRGCGRRPRRPRAPGSARCGRGRPPARPRARPLGHARPAPGGSASPRRVATSSCSDSIPSDLDVRHQRGLQRPRTRQHEPPSPARRTPSATASAPGSAGPRRSATARRRPRTPRRLRLELIGRDEQGDRERQVERRADLAQVGRGEVDRDPSQRGLEA